MNKYINFLIEPFLNKKLRILTFFITARCDSKCKHCFYWKNLRKYNDLPLKDIRKISRSIGNFYFLNISGGEPFLRDDLPEICYTFYTQNKVRDISIPTNSMQPKRILELTKKILNQCPKARLTINISLDGLEDLHNLTRGVKEAFKKAVQNINNITELKKYNPHLVVNVSTVVSSVNINEFDKIIAFVKHNLKIDNHSFEILRGNPKHSIFRPLNSSQFKKFKNALLVNNYSYFRKKGKFKAWYLRKRLKYFFDQQHRFLDNKKWDVPCLAGTIMAVIEPNGDVKPCELLESIGNLKEFDYDLKKLLNSEKTKKMQNWIKKTKCSCTHCVALNASISHNPLTVFIKSLLK